MTTGTTMPTLESVGLNKCVWLLEKAVTISRSAFPELQRELNVCEQNKGIDE